MICKICHEVVRKAIDIHGDLPALGCILTDWLDIATDRPLEYIFQKDFKTHTKSTKE